MMIASHDVEPMEPLTRQIIHPDNIALEHRIREAETLKSTNVFQLKLRRWRLAKTAQRYDQASHHYNELRQMLATYREQYQASENPTERQALKQIAGRIRRELHQTEALVSRLKPAWLEYERATQQLGDYVLAQQHLKTEQEIFKNLSREARIYGQYIREAWTLLPGCHHRWTDKKGKLHTETPRFARVDITPDAIYFKVKASQKGYFGWKFALPYGVTVHDLTDEKTIQNIAAACGRQVLFEINPFGVWIIINRLSSPDGLLDHVPYQQTLEYYPQDGQTGMPICVGVGKNRMIKWLYLSQWAHWLIAGWTGGGKSNIANVMVCTLISHHPPTDVRIALIDLKGGVEFDDYKGIPHLLGEIVTDISKVADLLERIEAEMASRFEAMRRVKARDIDTYNERVSPEKHMPRIVIFFDEFASITKQGDVSKRIQASVQQLTAKGRAPGVHVVICTQHPSVDIVPGPIKTNLQVRLSGRMPTTSASLTTLGSGDAKELAAVPGRMMLMISPDPEPIQTPHIEPPDMSRALETAKRFPVPEYQLPEGGQTHQQWTPERLAEFSLKHLDGHLGGRKIWEAIGDDSIGRDQIFKLVEQVWSLKEICFEGKTYSVQKMRHGVRRLVEVEREPA